MKNENRELLINFEKTETIILLSDVELGIIENEIFNYNTEGSLELIKFNKLEMILELNKKMFAN
jgi:hypothetical protein